MRRESRERERVESGPRAARFAAGLLVLVAAGLLVLTPLGCTWHGFLHQTGIPGIYTPAEVEFLGPRSAYLDAIVKTGDTELRFFFPQTEACRELLAGGPPLGFARLGPLGRLRAGDTRCEPIGLLSLGAWRDARPRPLHPQLVPREQAVFEVIYSDDELALARGRFPLALAIGWSGGIATIGIVPNADACQRVLAQGVASMEFRPAGPHPFSLLSGNQLCPLIGFAHEPGIL